ncbi:MAG: hypothetical protein IPM24_10870 [Bryobacterales bacterium]|nr:hypothetical protein [Bryobacterales bacterium]
MSPDRIHALLLEVRQALLVLHKALLDRQRAEYEDRNGRVAPVALLELTLNNPEFAWLRPFSRLVVDIDAALAPKHAPIEGPIASRLLDSALRLVRPGEAVESRYVEMMSNDPDLILLHASVVQAIRDARAEGLDRA